MGREEQNGWCILRTSGPRTLKLAASLAAAGFDVWTPQQLAQRRRGRARERVEVPAPIVPTFVFARAHHVRELLAAAVAMPSPHPPFSIFRHRDRIPVVADRGLAALRDEEEKHRRRAAKAQRNVLPVGTGIRLAEGAFAGMTGVVEGGNGKAAVVNFGGGFIVSIATYLLGSDVVQVGNRPAMGIAA